MDRWLRANRRGARGEHRYAADDFGLTTDGIRNAFAEYITRFDVAVAS